MADRHRRPALTTLAACLAAAAASLYAPAGAAAEPPTTFEITYTAEVRPGPISARVYVMLGPAKGGGGGLGGGPTEPRFGPNWFRPDDFAPGLPDVVVTVAAWLHGAILLASESYADRTGAINGILSVMDNGADPAQYKVVQSPSGFVVHLVAANNEIISYSELYTTRSNATRAITSCVRATTSYLDKRMAVSTGARVEVDASTAGGFHFNLFAKNGQIVLSSEHYTTDAAAYNGAFAVQDSATYTVKANASGGYYFTVSATNGQVVGTSQQYSTKESAQTGAAAVQALVKTVSIL